MAACACFCGRELASFLPWGVTWLSGPNDWDKWQLCALSAPAAEQMADRPLLCRTLLLPEGMYCPAWQASQVVSYGLSGRSSLTLSSMGDRDLLCVQRTLVDRSGRSVEEQELCLPRRWGRVPPADRLLLAGIWLLWGGLPPDTGN